MEIITSHQNIDFDGLASIIAAKKLYPKAKCILPNTIENNVHEFLKKYPEIKKNFSILSPDNYKKINLLILVDTQESKRLGDLSDILNNNLLKIHIYDHHPKDSTAIKGELEICKNYGATITLIVEKLKEKNIPISPLEATLFILGIYEDTGSLTYMPTTPEDIETAAYLLRYGANLNIISFFINRDLTHEQISLLNTLALSSHVYIISNIKITIACAEIDKYMNDIAILAHKLMDMDNLEVLFCIVKMGLQIYLIARSKREEINVGEIAMQFGGGGHPTASSANIKNLTIEETIKKILYILTTEIQIKLKAQDIMSSPVITLNEDTTIEETKKIIIRFNHSGFPVVNKGNDLVGIITRQDVERASLHGLGNTSIKSYMSRSLITAAPETYINIIHNIMMTNNIGRLPIIDKENKLLGIITRTDILQVLNTSKEKGTDSYYKKNYNQEDKNLSKYLKSRLSGRIIEILEKAGYIADSMGYSAYVAGGFVRDILIGNKNLDVDIVVEGEGIHFAEKLAETYKGSVESYHKFGTAVVILPDGFKIDIATARTEFYEYPTALPEVKSSSIKYDLYRRDFTINAMAINLNPGEFGKLVDFFGGVKDIKKGTIRVLYNLSFIDDPTRIFRAIRFEQRLHFKIDKQTEHFIDNAIKLGVFDKIANQRVRNELILILSEKKPLNAIKRMAELKVLLLIHNQLKFTTEMEKLFNSIYEVTNWFRLLYLQLNVEYWIVYFMAVIKEVKESEIHEILIKFKFNHKHIDTILSAYTCFSTIIKKLQSPKNLHPSNIYKLLNPLPPETILFIMANTHNNFIRKKISLFLTHYKEQKPFISGNDLIALGIKPSKKFKNIMEEILYLKLDGKIKTKEDEIEFVKNLKLVLSKEEVGQKVEE